MKKREKIFLVIIIGLTLSLIIMTIAFFNMKKIAEKNLNLLLENQKQIYELNLEMEKLENKTDQR